MRTISKLFIPIGLVVLLVGCTIPPPPPLTYLALNRPAGTIRTHQSSYDQEHQRGGFYFLNAGFRPAPRTDVYLLQAVQQTQQPILRNADVEYKVPIAIDLLLCGYNWSSDRATVGPRKDSKK